MKTGRVTVVLVCLVVVQGACQPLSGPGAQLRQPGERLITEAEIVQSGAANVWDLLRIRVHGYDYRVDRYGQPLAIKTHRGASSIILAGGDTPIVVIDGARVSDPRYLLDVSTESVDRIELLSGIRGTVTQGTNAAAGVIYIHTKSASDP